MDKYYTVAQTSKLTGLKPYVLRYWEEELELRIHRNEQGHRCYTRYDIHLFLNIKELKNRGLHLKAIKEVIPQLTRILPGASDSKIKLLEENASEEVTEAEFVETQQKEETFETVNNPKIIEFQKILERLIAQELHIKLEGEKRWQNVDAAIRRQQIARREAAVASEKRNRKGQIWKKDL